MIIILKGTLSREECFLSSWEKPIAVVSDAIFFLDLLSCIMMIDCDVKMLNHYISLQVFEFEQTLNMQKSKILSSFTQGESPVLLVEKPREKKNVRQGPAEPESLPASATATPEAVAAAARPTRGARTKFNNFTGLCRYVLCTESVTVCCRALLVCSGF